MTENVSDTELLPNQDDATPEPEHREDDKGGEDEPAPKPAKPTDSAADQTVPLGALHEERARRKAAEQAQERLSSRLDQIMARLDDANSRPAPAAAVDDDPEPPEDDFAGRLDWRTRQIYKQQQETAKRLDQIENGSRSEREQRQVIDRYTAQSRSYLNDHPDYADAYRTIQGQRVAELMAITGASEAQARQQTQAEEFQLAQMSLRQGRNPAEIIHRMAQARGWQPKAADPTPILDVQDAKPHRDAPRSLSSAAGKPAGGPISVKKLADMSDKEFAMLMDKDPTVFKKALRG